MSKDEFYSRKGANKTDSYLLLGSNKQIVNAVKEASTKGWDGSISRTTYEDNDGRSSNHQYFGALNADNLKQLSGRNARGGITTFKSVLEKSSITTMHEAGHPKFKDHKNAYSDGHVPGTIMDAAPEPESEHDAWMINKLKYIHGTVDCGYCPKQK